MLKARVLTALVLLLGFLAALFGLPGFGWLGVVSVIAALGAWEWGGLAHFNLLSRRFYTLLIGLSTLLFGAVSLVSSGPHGFGTPGYIAAFYAVSALFWLWCVPLWLSRKWYLASLSAATVIGWLLLVPTALAMFQLRQISPWLLLAVMALVWIADIAAFFTGRRWGRNKLAPTISPGKSREGALGAIAGVVAYGWLVAAFFAPLSQWSWLQVLIFTVALVGLTGLSIVGDLFESLMKRQAGVKDSGTLLPGHGGVLDRIDSLTSTLPLVGLVITLFIG